MTNHLTQISLCEALEKNGGMWCCISKKIGIRCNHWGLLALIHDFLFNKKSALPLNDYIYEAIAQLTNQITQISLCEA
ncbi:MULTISPECIES: hypothetical protein [Okeania]|uniref:hypothetical protein n=1 Tax=Okeania TaxID=1458928 RepID=UPI000F54534C|nr:MULTISPECIES: hypothetical protein [Okeania]NES78865.1 hypothetical protein [Okeania sp. SIO1H4]NET22839.1 hypothetical protein [Okeania sp. SIO1H5]NET95798.1 hypothetical protein [Okeania sp. SIO1H2]